MSEAPDKQKEQLQHFIQACQWELEGKTVQTLTQGIWQDVSPSNYGAWRRYRLKPEPPKVLEAWLRVFEDGDIKVYRTAEEAYQENRFTYPSYRVVHVKDVSVITSEVEDLRNELAFYKSIIQARP